jgi:hypothetical protein
MVAIFHAAWMRRLLLTVCRSLIPKPPFSLGWQMSSQDLKAMGEVGPSSWIPAHQNLLMMALILPIKVLEKRTVDI